MKDVIVRVPTKEDWIDVVGKALTSGCWWNDLEKRMFLIDWEMEKENTCVRIIDKEMGHAPYWFYREKYPNIPIISTQEYLREDFLIKYIV